MRKITAEIKVKTCVKCKETKNVQYFYSRGKSTAGFKLYSSVCRGCCPPVKRIRNPAVTKAWRERQPEEWKIKKRMLARARYARKSKEFKKAELEKAKIRKKKRYDFLKSIQDPKYFKLLENSKTSYKKVKENPKRYAKILAVTRAYKAAHKNKVKIYNTLYRKRHSEKYRKLSKEQNSNYRQTLHPTYIRTLIKMKYGKLHPNLIDSILKAETALLAIKRINRKGSPKVTVEILDERR
jgi:hypothetical protein